MFTKLRKEIDNYDKARETLIIQSRSVLKSAKLLIYSIHRKQEIEKNKTTLIKEKKALDIIAKKEKRFVYEGSYSDAMQEYVEAIEYYSFYKTGKILGPEKVKAEPNDYLMGICDLTGELGRKSVMAAIDNDIETVKNIKEFVDNIFKEFLKMNLRNGQVRKKSDSIKWNLKKIEEVLYDLSIRKNE